MNDANQNTRVTARDYIVGFLIVAALAALSMWAWEIGFTSKRIETRQKILIQVAEDSEDIVAEIRSVTLRGTNPSTYRTWHQYAPQFKAQPRKTQYEVRLPSGRWVSCRDGCAATYRQAFKAAPKEIRQKLIEAAKDQATTRGLFRMD